MIDIKEIKHDAKNKLKINYKNTLIINVLTVLIILAVYIGVYLILKLTNFTIIKLNIIILIVEILILSLFSLGYYNFYLKISRGENVSFKELFFKIEMYLNALLISLLMIISHVFGLILLLIPGLIMFINYSQSLFISADNKDLNPIECMIKSRILMKGNKLKYIKLILSFLKYYLILVPLILLIIIRYVLIKSNILYLDKIISIYFIIILIYTPIFICYARSYINISLAIFYNLIKK